MGNNKHWYNKTFSSVKNFSSDFMYGVGIGSDYLRYPIHKARQGIDVIDYTVQHGSKVPLFNDVLSLLTDNPIYAEALGLVHSVDKSLEDISKLGYDAQKAIGVSPFYSQQRIHNNFRYDHNFDTPQVVFDQGFVAARQDIARIRGEPQISGAVDYASSFQRPQSTPAEISSSNTSNDAIDGSHIPSSEVDVLHYAEPIKGSIDIGYASDFVRPISQPVQTSPSQSVS